MSQQQLFVLIELDVFDDRLLVARPDVLGAVTIEHVEASWEIF